MTCDRVMDLLPDLVSGRLAEPESDEVRAHLADCVDCRAEASVLEALAEAGPATAPEGLEERVVTAALEAWRPEAPAPGGAEGVTPIRRRGLPTWMMGAAAVLVLALGTPALMERMADSDGGATDPVAAGAADEFEEPVATVWASEDGLIAGAPVFETLTDEELARLLEEFEG